MDAYKKTIEIREAIKWLEDYWYLKGLLWATRNKFTEEEIIKAAEKKGIKLGD